MDLRRYQRKGVDFLTSHDEALLMWEMGTGKTRTVLAALMRERLLTGLPALVVGTKRIIATQKVWEQEAAELELPLTFTRVTKGKQTIKPADVITITYDLLKSEAGQAALKMCKIIVFDELTYLKAFSQRFKAVRKHLPGIRKRWGLTGTPAPNGLLDLFYQVQCLDLGKRFSKNKDQFRREYFYPVDPNGYKWKPRSEQAIYKKLDGLVHRVGNEGLPEIVTQPVEVPLSRELRAQYDELAREMVLELEDGELVVTPSQAALQSKLRQICSGFVYHDEDTVRLDSTRLEAVTTLLDELQGQNALVVYEYREQREQLLAAIDGAETLDADGAVDRWNAGETPALVMHAASGGHGLNLQFGGHHVIWMTMTWRWDLFAQVNRRVARPGGAETAFSHVLVAPGTVEPRIYREVLTGKAGAEQRLLEAMG